MEDSSSPTSVLCYPDFRVQQAEGTRLPHGDGKFKGDPALVGQPKDSPEQEAA
jgi:hypothetical protein